MNIDDLYYYRAKIVSIYDGDTMTLDIDLGFGHWMTSQKVRLYGIDTPELRGEEREEGLKVRDFVRELLPNGTEVMIKSHRDKSGKYGRWLVEVIPMKWFGNEDRHATTINEVLIAGNMAKPYFP